MSVHIYKYGLKWLHGRNISSSINVWFCAYCVHLPGIDIQGFQCVTYLLPAYNLFEKTFPCNKSANILNPNSHRENSKHLIDKTQRQFYYMVFYVVCIFASLIYYCFPSFKHFCAERCCFSTSFYREKMFTTRRKKSFYRVNLFCTIFITDSHVENGPLV